MGLHCCIYPEAAIARGTPACAQGLFSGMAGISDLQERTSAPGTSVTSPRIAATVISDQSCYHLLDHRYLDHVSSVSDTQEREETLRDLCEHNFSFHYNDKNSV